MVQFLVYASLVRHTWITFNYRKGEASLAYSSNKSMHPSIPTSSLFTCKTLNSLLDLAQVPGIDELIYFSFIFNCIKQLRRVRHCQHTKAGVGLDDDEESFSPNHFSLPQIELDTVMQSHHYYPFTQLLISVMH